MASVAVVQPTIATRLTGAGLSRRRAVTDVGMRAVALAAALLCTVPLAAVLFFVATKGAAAMNLDLITKPPRALGIGGGAASAVLGTLQMVPLATLMALPVGILGAV